MCDLTFAFLLLAARKRAFLIRETQLLSHFILIQLVPDIFRYTSFIFTCAINIIPSAPKLTIAIFKLQIAKLFMYHQTTFAFYIANHS